MKFQFAAATLAALTLAATAGAARAAEFTSVPLETTIDKPADVAWKKISGFCDIGAWMHTTCVVTSGKDGEVGAVRRIADRIDELLVANTAWSYTYSQPKSPNDYHGTVEIRPVDKGHSKLLYTLVYDAAPLPTPEAKAAAKENYAKRFTVVLATMKGIAEK
jgi:Polyketide cyclase / dehydrase and lipid transport